MPLSIVIKFGFNGLELIKTVNLQILVVYKWGLTVVNHHRLFNGLS